MPAKATNNLGNLLLPPSVAPFNVLDAPDTNPWASLVRCHNLIASFHEPPTCSLRTYVIFACPLLAQQAKQPHHPERYSSSDPRAKNPSDFKGVPLLVLFVTIKQWADRLHPQQTRSSMLQPSDQTYLWSCRLLQSESAESGFLAHLQRPANQTRFIHQFACFCRWRCYLRGACLSLRRCQVLQTYPCW